MTGIHEKREITDRNGLEFSEKSMALLLHKLYEEPSIRPSFRTELLERLRAKQRSIVELRRIRQRRIFFASAAAAAVLLSLTLPFLPPLGGLRSSPSSSLSTTSTLSSSTPLIQKEREEKAATVTSERKPENGILLLTDGKIEICEGGSSWRLLEAHEPLLIPETLSIRTSPDAISPTALQLSNGVGLLLDPSTSLRLTNRKIILENGSAVVRVTEKGTPMEFSLLDCAVAFEKGAMAALHVKNGREYAEGGAPAPVVILLKGQGYCCYPEGRTAPLEMGRLYQLYQDRYLCRTLGESERGILHEKTNARLASFLSRGSP